MIPDHIKFDSKNLTFNILDPQITFFLQGYFVITHLTKSELEIKKYK